jgi:hypothetical protein
LGDCRAIAQEAQFPIDCEARVAEFWRGYVLEECHGFAESRADASAPESNCMLACHRKGCRTVAKIEKREMIFPTRRAKRRVF